MYCIDLTWKTTVILAYFFFSFFFWYCFLVDPFHLSTVSTFFHCEPRLGLNHMGSKVPVLISACF